MDNKAEDLQHSREAFDSRESLALIVEQIRNLASGRSIAFVSGNFNVLHPGHLRLLKFASECAEFLVVGVHQQGTSGALVEERLRLEGVKSINMVNFAFVLHHSVTEILGSLKPDIVVKGREHESLENPERKVVEANGGKLLFGSGDIHFSSVDFMRRELRETIYCTPAKPFDYLERHGISFNQMKSVISRFNDLNIVVIGDLIVDEYISCEPVGMSQEDPTIVVTPTSSQRFIGGASIVAAHARGLGAKVKLFSLVGPDSAAAFAEDRLNELGVDSVLFEDESRPTPLKQRFRAKEKTLLRVNHLRHHEPDSALLTQMMATIKSKLENVDLVIFSDFNYGALPQSLVKSIVGHCIEHKVKMVADSQSSSQIGDVSRFEDMILLTPTEREARLAVRDFNSGLVVLAESLREKSNAQNVILTLGSEGVLIHAKVNPRSKEWHTDRLPAFNPAPRDPSGAGDSFLTCASMALALGESIWLAAYLGSLAAACQISRVGNIPLVPTDIERELQA